MQSSPTSASIVAIVSDGLVSGYQLRVNGGGAGNTKFFATKKHGGQAKARRGAEQLVRSLGLPRSQKAGGSKQGRLLSTNATGAAGIRFVWSTGALTPTLRVIATWIDKGGKPRHTSYSVERNGLDGALDKAIKARTLAGASAGDRDALLKALRLAHRSGMNYSESQ